MKTAPSLGSYETRTQLNAPGQRKTPSGRTVLDDLQSLLRMRSPRLENDSSGFANIDHIRQIRGKIGKQLELEN